MKRQRKLSALSVANTPCVCVCLCAHYRACLFVCLLVWVTMLLASGTQDKGIQLPLPIGLRTARAQSCQTESKQS